MSAQHYGPDPQHKNCRSFQERMFYHLDVWMSRGTGSMLVLLFIITGIIVIAGNMLGELISERIDHRMSAPEEVTDYA